MAPPPPPPAAAETAASGPRSTSGSSGSEAAKPHREPPSRGLQTSIIKAVSGAPAQFAASLSGGMDAASFGGMDTLVFVTTWRGQARGECAPLPETGAR